MKLTERKIEQLIVPSGGKDRLVFDDEQRGLAVRVARTAVAGKLDGKVYLCQYSLHQQKWRVPLGSCFALSLADARDAAAAIMGDVAKGMNPAEMRKEAARAEKARRAREKLTLRVLIDGWQHGPLAERRESYAAEAVRALHAAFTDRLYNPAENLDRKAVVRALDSKGAAMAGRTAAYGHAAFAWALKRGDVAANPFAEVPIAKSVNKRERTLTDDELVEIWRAAGDAASPYGTIIRLLILTGQRRGEVAGMTRSELSGDLTTWTIPRERAKNGVIHMVPLSAPAADLVRPTLPEDADQAKRVEAELRISAALVLPGKDGPYAGWSKSKCALDAAIAEAREEAAAKVGATAAPLVPWSVHDLRRTVATGLQRLGVRLEVTEAVLNHISGSRGGIAGVYQLHDWAVEKRAALDAWAAHVLAIVEQRTPAIDNVLTFPGSAIATAAS
jgi:integrase